MLAFPKRQTSSGHLTLFVLPSPKAKNYVRGAACIAVERRATLDSRLMLMIDDVSDISYHTLDVRRVDEIAHSGSANGNLRKQ